jgi:hypothetical protein
MFQEAVLDIKMENLLLEVSEHQELRVGNVAWTAQRIPTTVNLGFLKSTRYFFIQVAPQLSSRG